MHIHSDAAKTEIPLVFRTIAHLYDPDDPTPESGRMLSDRAEDMIGHAILDAQHPLQAGTKNKLVIELPAGDLTPDRKQDIPSAVHAHFAARAEEIHRAMRLTQRIGFREIRLTIGVCIPAFIGIIIADHYPHVPFWVLLENILIIVSWVVIWQPFQSLVFDRWTNAEQAKVYRQIARMDIAVCPARIIPADVPSACNAGG
jgi:hypothetical protein